MKMGNNYSISAMKRIFQRENEQLMLAVNRIELQEMQRLAEYGY